MLKSTLFAVSALTVLGATAAHAIPATGLSGNTLFSFDTATPTTATNTVGITGLRAGESVIGIDYRPASDVLYGLTTSSALYTINAFTGAATLASSLNTTAGAFTVAAGEVAISFNPVPDRLRVISTTGQNLRINVDTGATIVDTPVAFRGATTTPPAAADPNFGDTPALTAAAYTNQVRGAVASSVLYDIDTTNDVLVIQNPPNNGVLNTVGSLGVGDITSFDIDGLTNAAFAASGSSFYSVDLATGAATLVGSFGQTGVTDFALTPVPEPMTLALLGTGLAGIVALRRRRA
ncbi:MAG: DUF4394 domain-containing protein [Gemmatimonadaceae bacterium]|nr:DUF4394 domain-containing protein [Acetobacteraceae bacterium]